MASEHTPRYDVFSLLYAFFIFLSFFSQAYASTITLDLGDVSGSMTGRLIQLFILFTILSLAPSIIIMVTSFTRMIVVFSFLRSALGLQQSPPNIVLISLSLFLTAFVMSPVLEKAYEEGIRPLIEEKIEEKLAFEKTMAPFKIFMLHNVREKDLQLFVDLSRNEKIESAADTPLKILVPAFLISELRRAFEIGFLIFIPFLIIDMVVASVLMAMGMMMVPPVMIALPFKLIFFVLVDGWNLVCGSLVNSFTR
ncbi:MAG: flagellar type III secretion system pore protein FliP [Proteobacteria bacterium]|nr:flagellar type III secretion system pore protein FliP [Pseudomonadota bacterium]